MIIDVNLSKKAGIYKITCINNGKFYIGKSVNLYSRLNYHKSRAKKITGSTYFEKAMIKHGWDSFEVEILEIFENFDKYKDNDKLLELEASLIKKFNSFDGKIGYNICQFSTDRTGHKCSDETRRKMSLSRIGKPLSEETREKLRKPRKPGSEEFKRKCRERTHTIESKKKMRQAKLGKSLSEETKEKLSKCKKGKPLSDEHKENARFARLGYTHTEETKEKMRKTALGRINSKESRDKMRLAKLGKPLSEETKQKMSKAKLGKILSEETKQKMSKAKSGIPKSEERRNKIRDSRSKHLDNLKNDDKL